MKILQLSAVKNWGGGENHIEALCTELQKSAPEVKNIILCVRNGRFHQKLKDLPLPFITAPLAIKMDLRFVLKIISTCKKESIDLIHIHDPAALALAIIADKFYDLPPFIFSKKTSFPIKDRKQTLYKYNYPKLERILCVSEETKRVAAEKIKDRGKLATIYHGTRLDNKSSKTPFLLRDKLNIPIDKKIVGTIGNHIRAKNLETLVETAHQVVNIQKRKDILFVQIGTFTDRTPQLKTEIERLNLSQHLIFLGFIPDASNFIPQFDLLLLTSQSEGIPQVIYEAFYHKRPVISTNVGGIPEIIDHGSTGYISAKEDAASLAENIISTFENPQLSLEFAENGYRKLIPKYTSENMARNTFGVYKDILEKKHSR